MKRRLHLVRASPGPTPPILDEGDWVVYLPGEPAALRLADHGAPPVPPGPIDHDQLVRLLFAADLVVTW